MKDVIIIPTYNEKKNIRKLLNIISSALPAVHILVVDDNSPDGTGKEVQNAKKEIPNLELFSRPKKEGLRKAYVAAFKKVLNDGDVRFICTMDADFSHNINYLVEMLKFSSEYDVIIGSRYVQGGGVRGWPLKRKILSRAAYIFCKIFLFLPINDFTSGFLCIKADALRKVDLDSIKAVGFTFLIELKYLLWQKKCSFKEIPIILDNRQEGESKITGSIIFEGLLTVARLVSGNFSRKISNFSATVVEVLNKRSIFFIIYFGPIVFYKSFIAKKSGEFLFQGKKYPYFNHLYNCTCLNERAVEVPIVEEVIKRFKGKRILEFGNVLSHYHPFFHDILDKYEKAENVTNQDVVDFSPSKKYDLIVSISTLEHVGWDEKPRDPMKILTAFSRLKDCLVPGGKMIITLPLGYNSEMDKLLEDGKFGFTNIYFLKKNSKNKWVEVTGKEVRGITFDHFRISAKGLAIGTVGDFFN